MKIISNRYIPFGKYTAINLFGIMFVREGVKVTRRLVNHESIHTAQMRELLYLPFYIIYTLEWAVRLMVTLNPRRAYRDISFEREAYDNDARQGYLARRRHFAQWRVRKPNQGK